MVEVGVNVSVPVSLGSVVAEMVAVVAWLVSVISIVTTKPVHVHCGGAVGGVNLGQGRRHLIYSQHLKWKSEREIIFFQVKAGNDV